MGFIGGKLPLRHGPAEGEEGLRANLAALAEMRERVGDDFWLMWDCWMSLDVDYATRLAHAADGLGLRWIEEPLLPDDYWGHAELRRRMPARMLLTAGEHEATRWGFRLLLELGAVDLVQPDVGWCGGITELLRIAAVAASYGLDVSGHCAPGLHLAPLAAVPNLRHLEWFHDHVRIESMLFDGAPDPAAGSVSPSGRPGHGMTWLPDAATAFRVA
jgi:L-rhamnonate dehydratase